MIALAVAAVMAAFFSGCFVMWGYTLRHNGYLGYEEAPYAFAAFLGLVSALFGYLAVTL